MPRCSASRVGWSFRPTYGRRWAWPPAIVCTCSWLERSGSVCGCGYGELRGHFLLQRRNGGPALVASVDEHERDDR